MYQQGIDLALLGLEAVVVNYYRPNNASALREWRADGVATFVLDTEGGVLSESGHDAPEAFAKALGDLRVEDGVDGYLFWGAKVADAVRTSGALPPERIAPTGCPRFDLCAEPWRRRLGPRTNDYILINTNFSLINPAQSSSIERETDTMVASGWTPGYVRELTRDLQAVFKSYLDCLDTLTGTLRGQRFRIRPHPFENQGLYVRRFGSRSNVEVNGEGNVAAAIQGTACVLHLNCGSAVEAAMLGRVPIQLEFLNTPVQRAHAPLPRRVSRQAMDASELITLLRQPESLDSAFDLAGVVERELKPFFGALDGRAAERVADFIIDRLKQIGCVPGHPPSLVGALGSGRRRAGVGQVLQGTLGVLFGTAAVARLREVIQPTRREKRLDVDRIDTITRELAMCEGRPPGNVKRGRHPLSGLPLESVTISNPA
jgi:surface carbohydrate biosynthesis protein